MSLAEQYCWYCNEHLEKCTCKKLAPSPLSGEEIKPFDSAGIRVHFLLNLKKAQLMEYIYDFAWHYGRLYHIGDAEKIKEAIKEKFQLPEEFLYELLNSDQDAQASVATKVESSTSDGKQNNSSNSGEQQQVTGGMKNALESILERVKYENRGWLESPTETIDAIMEICFNALASQPPTPVVTGELYRWVSASEKPSQHYVNVCCRLIGEDFWFTAYYDWSKKMYVPRNFSGSGGYIDPKEIEYQVEVEPGEQLWNEIEKLENSMMMKGGNTDGEKLKWFIENVKVLIKNQEVEPGDL